MIKQLACTVHSVRRLFIVRQLHSAVRNTDTCTSMRLSADVTKLFISIRLVLIELGK